MRRKGTVIILLLLTFFQPAFTQGKDTLNIPLVSQWTLSDDYTEEIRTDVDTAFTLFHRYRITDKFSPMNAFPGNYGQPLYQINFFDRITNPDMFLYRFYYPYMHLASNPIFMDTKVPFTEAVFTYAGARETADQTFRIRHTQNINRFLNFGLVYDIVNSRGQYNYQKTNDEAFTFHTSYRGEKYRLYFSAGINNIENSENGGIVDEGQLKTFATRDVEVKLGSLNKAKSVLKNNSILLVQRLTVGGRKQQNDSLKVATKGNAGLNGTFSHIFIWEKSRRSYSDDNPASGFYDTAFISNTATFDSLSERSVKNTLRFDFTTDPSRKFRLGGGGGITNEILRYSQIIPSSYSPPSDTAVWHESNNVLKGLLFNDIGKKFRWKATGELYLTGFRAGDFNVGANITKIFGEKDKSISWDIYGSVSSIKPSVWYYRWGSNHFVWNNDFLKEFRMEGGTKFDYPRRRFYARFDYGIIDNYTDFGPDTLPSQHHGGLSVASAFLGKDFSVWKFHLSSQVLLQKTSNCDILDLPFASLKIAAYFEHNFQFPATGGNLNTQLGVDMFYHTSYYAYNYNPSTGAFFRQADKLVGNYPFLNAFVNLKIRRTRIFLMLDHFNSGFTGYNYFLVPGYPMYAMTFRYGIAWTFYD